MAVYLACNRLCGVSTYWIKGPKKEVSNSNSRNKILSNLKDFSNSVKGDQQIACKMAVTGLTRAGKSRFYVF